MTTTMRMIGLGKTNNNNCFQGYNINDINIFNVRITSYTTTLKNMSANIG